MAFFEERQPPSPPHECSGVLERIHRAEERVAALEQRCQLFREEVQQLSAWRKEDEERSRWFYASEPDLKYLVDSKRWVTATRSAMAWLIGSVVGALMTWEAIANWAKAHKWW